MSDLVERLRDRAYSFRIVDRLCVEAADEIARLRGDAEVARLRLDASHGEIEKLQHRVRFQDSVIRSGDVATLTNEERKAIQDAMLGGTPATDEEEARMVATLRGLLERLGGGQ